VGHWERDTVIGENHKGTILTIMKCKNGLEVIVKVGHKNFELVCNAIVEVVKPFAGRVIKLT
jgi:IS30 family transposase